MVQRAAGEADAGPWLVTEPTRGDLAHHAHLPGRVDFLQCPAHALGHARSAGCVRHARPRRTFIGVLGPLRQQFTHGTKTRNRTHCKAALGRKPRLVGPLAGKIGKALVSDEHCRFAVGDDVCGFCRRQVTVHRHVVKTRLQRRSSQKKNSLQFGRPAAMASPRLSPKREDLVRGAAPHPAARQTWFRCHRCRRWQPGPGDLRQCARFRGARCLDPPPGCWAFPCCSRSFFDS